MSRTKKLFKVCGLQSIKDLKICAENNVDLVGLNFVPSSSRYLTTEVAQKICAEKSTPKKVGIFQNQPLDFVNRTAIDLNLDYIQLSGNEDQQYIEQCHKPVIKGISIQEETFIPKLAKISYILIDGQQPGSGETFNWELLGKIDTPYILAGGINLENIQKALQLPNLIGIDVASGTETNGSKDPHKIQQLANLIHND